MPIHRNIVQQQEMISILTCSSHQCTSYYLTSPNR